MLRFDATRLLLLCILLFEVGTGAFWEFRDHLKVFAASQADQPGKLHLNDMQVVESHNSYKEGTTHRRQAAFASGAQVITTDYYRPDPEFETGY